MKRVNLVYAPEFTHSGLMYQPLKTVVLPMALPELEFDFIPVAFPLVMTNGSGEVYYREDVSAAKPKWFRLERREVKWLETPEG